MSIIALGHRCTKPSKVGQECLDGVGTAWNTGRLSAFGSELGQLHAIATAKSRQYLCAPDQEQRIARQRVSLRACPCEPLAGRHTAVEHLGDDLAKRRARVHLIGGDVCRRGTLHHQVEDIKRWRARMRLAYCSRTGGDGLDGGHGRMMPQRRHPRRVEELSVTDSSELGGEGETE